MHQPRNVPLSVAENLPVGVAGHLQVLPGTPPKLDKRVIVAARIKERPKRGFLRLRQTLDGLHADRDVFLVEPLRQLLHSDRLPPGVSFGRRILAVARGGHGRCYAGNAAARNEYVEVTPKSIRLRKSLLDENDRKRAAKQSKLSEPKG